MCMELGTLLQTIDLGELSNEQVIELFNEVYCSQMKGSLKILHFQCCRYAYILQIISYFLLNTIFLTEVFQ